MTVNRLAVLDGWRGLSILLVLLGHLFPIGPKAWELNAAVAGSGMALFFTLSGFLITNVLLKGRSIRVFLIHRVMRIVPLAWLAMLLVLVLTRAAPALYASHLLFYGNLIPGQFFDGTGHFWSLCVEMQFYLGVAILGAVFGRRALFALPLLALAVTGYRVTQHALMDISTPLRVDEILAGCTLALAWRFRPEWLSGRGWRLVPFLLAPLLVAAGLESLPVLDYLRPYIASTLVGSTLGPDTGIRLRRLLSSRILRYIAEISFALYVVHGCLMASWLNDGDKLVRYLKRPLFLAVTWLLAHLSTRYYESFFIRLGRRWAHE
jgi:peptidoglycan/LPS O-acetylase OafA/YrhL